MGLKFWIVDTFSDKKFQGVPAVTFFTDEFDDETLLQNIAMEINAPETMFIKKRSDEVFESVCYTPRAKGLFLGNALYASAHVINETTGLSQFSIMCGIRVFLVEVIHPGEIKIRFSTIELEKTTTPLNLSSALQNELVVSLAESKNELVVEVRNPNRLLELSPSMDMLSSMDYNSFVITADTRYTQDLNYDLYARVFAPKLGINESVISPIACTKLASYWAKRMGKSDLTISGGKGKKVSVETSTEYVYVTGNSVTSSTGEMLT
ncbi:MAG: PhzF family phenazine biosynthesis protein [Alphaproteobacteria bacterium]|nr:PhzF family phenazine biosynthesis protein [Alphaproteobacteria bacterium]